MAAPCVTCVATRSLSWGPEACDDSDGPLKGHAGTPCATNCQLEAPATGDTVVVICATMGAVGGVVLLVLVALALLLYVCRASLKTRPWTRPRCARRLSRVPPRGVGPVNNGAVVFHFLQRDARALRIIHDVGPTAHAHTLTRTRVHPHAHTHTRTPSHAHVYTLTRTRTRAHWLSSHASTTAAQGPKKEGSQERDRRRTIPGHSCSLAAA
jgi:hypothetical protein